MAGVLDRRFRTLLRDALATSMRPNTQTEKHVRALQAFVILYERDEAALGLMLDAYLDEYQQLEARHDKNARYISQAVFDQVFAKWVERATYYTPLLQQAMRLFLDKVSPTDREDRLWIRYQGLDAVKQSHVEALLRSKRQQKKNSLSFFEILIDLYFQRTGQMPPDDRALFGYAPMPNQELSKRYDVMTAAVLAAAGRSDTKALETALWAFARWATEADDVARSFQIFLWSRLIATKKAARPHQLDTWVWNELYLISAQRAIIAAINSGFGWVQRHFVSAEEVWIILEPLGPSRYYGDYADRLYPFTTDGSFAAGKAFMDAALLHLNLLIFAEQRGLYLESADQRDALLDRIVAEGAQLRRLRWYLAVPGFATLNRTVRIGSSIEGVATVVFVSEGGLIYITFNGLKHVLFSGRGAAVGRIISGHYVDQLIAGTQHLLILIPAFFELLQYVASFITGGIPGLIEEFVENIVADVAANVAERITDNRAVLIGVSALNPSTLLVPGRAVARAGGRLVAKKVRKVLNRPPEGHLPKATAQFRQRGSKPPKQPIVRPPKPKRRPKIKLKKRRGIYRNRGVFESEPAKVLRERTNLSPNPMNENDRSKIWGRFQERICGRNGYKATLSDGRRTEPDGIAYADDAPGKLDLIEAKHEGEHVTLENFDFRSMNWLRHDDKLDQMERYARYAQENADRIHKIRYVCSSKAVHDAFEILRMEALPANLRDFVIVELAP